MVSVSLNLGDKMKFKLVIGALAALGSVAHAANIVGWTNASKAYATSNLSQLATLAKASPNDQLITYLNASANLNKTNPNPALTAINSLPDSYFRNELLHQLLSYYFNNQDWKKYLNLFSLLPDKQASINETCGYDVANFALNQKAPLKSDLKNLIGDKMPLWCISLVASEINNGTLPKSLQLPFLLGLITNDQTFQFNQLAATFKLAKVNFSATINSSNQANPYQVAYRINALSGKQPEQAYSELAANNKIPAEAKAYLFNIVASDLAKGQRFNQALMAINQASNNYLADDELEWRTRTYLALSNWRGVLATINLMPAPLQAKSVWLYWRAFAEGKSGLKTQAQNDLLKIKPEYSFYSLLAQAELRTPLNITRSVTPANLGQINNADNVRDSFTLYQLGKQTNNSLLVRLATQNLYYLIAQASDEEIAAISQKAHSLGWSEMGISAATRMKTPQANLSFPLLFVSEYRRYSQQYGLQMSYPMAVTRQESRFNAKALAFDGGVGLMQIMPATATYIAHKAGGSNCFRDYACNIKFGSWFLAHLLTKFGNNYIYATAGYNAGPGRAHRWQVNFSTLDNRIQIELIPFKITRDYVQKVLTNKLVYDNLLYPERAQNDMLRFLGQINNQSTTFIVDDDNTQGEGTGSINQ
jgi:soluble lytic murein transglycosylase